MKSIALLSTILALSSCASAPASRTPASGLTYGGMQKTCPPTDEIQRTLEAVERVDQGRANTAIQGISDAIDRGVRDRGDWRGDYLMEIMSLRKTLAQLAERLAFNERIYCFNQDDLGILNAARTDVKNMRERIEGLYKRSFYKGGDNL